MSLRLLIISLVDPRGRCNRRGLLIAALLMLGVEAVMGMLMWLTGRGLDDPLMTPTKIAVLYLAFAASSQRLHDLGKSSIRIAWAMAALIAWAVAVCIATMLSLPPDRMAPGETGFLIVSLATMLPMLVMLLWLHLGRGEPGPNRYGPVPTGWGFARPHGRTRPVPAGTAAAA